MLLQRLTLHLKSQNWTAVAFEFLIVALGVFLGIQAQSWQESQREQQLLRDYLHRLKADFSLSITGTERTKAFVTSNLDNLSIVLNSLRECDVPKEKRDRFANGVFHMGKLIPAQFVDGTLEELRSSGRLLLVDNEELRDAINETVREHNYQLRVFPAQQQRVRSSHTYIRDRFIFWLDRPVNGFSNVSWEELEFEMGSTCSDKVLLSRLSDLRRTSSTSIAWLDRNLANFKNARALLEKELGNIEQSPQD
ncbi:hypothetical protein [Congregibacter sp.]|uniref:hypothetical protein n=1 Tax=Congregibacter sp. TaxID=2744308 RepID=UPI003F6B7232